MHLSPAAFDAAIRLLESAVPRLAVGETAGRSAKDADVLTNAGGGGGTRFPPPAMSARRWLGFRPGFRKYKNLYTKSVIDAGQTADLARQLAA